MLPKQNKHPGSAPSAGEIHRGQSLVPHFGQGDKAGLGSAPFFTCVSSPQAVLCSHPFPGCLVTLSAAQRALSWEAGAARHKQLGEFYLSSLLSPVIARARIEANTIEKGALADAVCGFLASFFSSRVGGVAACARSGLLFQKCRDEMKRCDFHCCFRQAFTRFLYKSNM